MVVRSAWREEDQILGESLAMRAVSARVERVARSGLSVLIHGETGTGKELVARAIHRRSPRRAGPFVSENCAALPESLLEAELFGHDAGAFTGSAGAREGLFARADGGTLFLDEVGDMPLSMQAKLLRVLQEGEVRRIGGARSRRVDVRVVAATHRDLNELVRAGRFREDLLFRLAVLEVRLPPLRERLEDIPLLAEHFLSRLAREAGRPKPLLLGDEALDLLLAHPWPGNVRELENAIRVGALFSKGDVLDPAVLPVHERDPSPDDSAEVDQELSYDELRQTLEDRERRYVRRTLCQTAGNKAEAARRLGITRYALYRTLRRLGISEEELAALSEEEAEAVSV